MSADQIEVAGIPVSTQHHIGGRRVAVGVSQLSAPFGGCRICGIDSEGGHDALAFHADLTTCRSWTDPSAEHLSTPDARRIVWHQTTVRSARHG